MGLVVLLALGGVIGWVASIITDTHARRYLVANIVLAAAASVIGAFACAQSPVVASLSLAMLGWAAGCAVAAMLGVALYRSLKLG